MASAGDDEILSLSAFFAIRADSVVRHSSLVTLSNYASGHSELDYTTIVSPRAGPTLTIDNLAPVNSEMCLTYFLAAEGNWENLRAA